MIRHRADALVQLIDRERALNAQVRQLEGFRGQLQEIERAAGRLAPLVATWKLFREKGIGDGRIDIDVAAILLQVIQLRDRYKSERSSILGSNRLNSIKSTISAADALESRLLDMWRFHTKDLVPNADAEVLNVLASIPALKRGVDAIWSGLRDLDNRSQHLPKNEAEIIAYHEIADTVRRRWDDFDSGQLPREVLQFLKEASGGGAALDSLNETVLEWLQGHNLMASFRVRSLGTRTGL